jgi:hypothetical protein
MGERVFLPPRAGEQRRRLSLGLCRESMYIPEDGPGRHQRHFGIQQLLLLQRVLHPDNRFDPIVFGLRFAAKLRSEVCLEHSASLLRRLDARHRLRRPLGQFMLV